MLDSLPAAVRRAFLLSQLEGLMYDASAARLDVSLASVKRYMKQAFLACLRLDGD
ncbi:putative RNA polymerase sigma factor FecI [compost metagenome]